MSASCWQCRVDPDTRERWCVRLGKWMSACECEEFKKQREECENE